MRRGIKCSTARYLFIFLGLAPLTIADPPHIATSAHQSPAGELASFTVSEGFEVQLVAAEPDIQKPINMAFDAKGRLWVTCTVEYPFPAEEKRGRDTIKVLSDFGPDGRARVIETFADGLNIPIGILPYQDGAIVYSIPNLWMLRDTDGDGKCDKRDVLYGGFGHRDTHGMVNGLFMGFDGWVYANHGYSNDSKLKGRDGHEVVMNSGNVFRFKPDGSRVELFAKGQVNPFGSCMDQWGNLFTACCHSKPITLVLRGGVYESFGKPHDGLGFAPAMVHEYRGSTALCGLAWYEADYFPKEYQEHFYLGDVVYNCINKFRVSWNGATPTAHQEGDFLKSSDPWFRPCDIKLGPDGALYVADFYNRIIGHYEVDLSHPGRDRTSGRIWRIVRKTTVPLLPNLRKSSSEQLVKDLDSPNITTRFLAMNQLTDRGSGVLPEVKRKLQDGGSPIGRSHAMWIMARLGIHEIDLRPLSVNTGPSATPELLINHRLRIIAESGRSSWLDGSLMNSLNPASIGISSNTPAVLRQLLETDGRLGGGRKAALLALTAIRDDPFLRHSARMVLRDSLMRDGLPIAESRSVWDQFADIACGASNKNGGELLRQYAKNFDVQLNLEQVKHCARFAEWTNSELSEFISRIDRNYTGDPIVRCNMVVAVAEGWAQRGESLPPTLADWCERIALIALRSPDPAVVQRGIDVAIAVSQPKLQDAVAAIVADKNRDSDIRRVGLPAIGSSHTAIVIRCLSDAMEAPPLRVQAAKTLANVNRPEARTALTAALTTAPSSLATVIANGLVTTKQGAEELLNCVEKGQASVRLLFERTVLLRLESHGFKGRVQTLTAGMSPTSEQIDTLIKKRRAGFDLASPDVEAGKLLFTKHCAICHQVGGQGAKVGPQLDGIGIRGIDRLLEDVLDPNRNIDPAFRSVTLQLTDGKSLSGLVLREEGQTVVIADEQGKEKSILKNQIELRTTSSLSAMPIDVAASMTESEFYSLMKYLISLRR